MTEFLTSTELTQLTGYQQANSRAKWLKQHGIPYQRNARGLIVSRIHARQWLEGKQQTPFGGINLAAIA